MKTLLLVDGNAIMHRAFFALPPFKTKAGIPTNAIYGFFTMLYKTIIDFNPNYVVICFDTPKPTFRKKLFKQYQTKRPEIADEFRVQIPLIKEFLDKGGIFHEEKEGFEADDLIGTIATKVKKNNIKVVILTGDRDILQLVDKNTYVVSPIVGLSQIKIYDEREVKEKLGVTPSQIPDYKALAGDASDNYPGARGIGPKTAITLVKEYKTVENLLKNLNRIGNDKLKATIQRNKKEILLSKKLAMIVTDAEVKFQLDQTQFNSFKKELQDAFLKLEMKSLATRFFPTTNRKSLKNNPEEKDSSKDPQINLF